MKQVTTMQSSSVKTGSRIMYAMGIYALVMSLFWIFLTEMIFVSDFLGYTGQSYSDFLASNPKPAEIYIVTKKLWGITMFLASLLIILITRKSYSKGEKWSWYALLIAGIMLWGSLIGYRIVIGYLVPSIVTFIIGAALFVIGIALPAKEILG
jgi:ABC-type polysaccharide/polyol phosphate export permease